MRAYKECASLNPVVLRFGGNLAANIMLSNRVFIGQRKVHSRIKNGVIDQTSLTNHHFRYNTSSIKWFNAIIQMNLRTNSSLHVLLKRYLCIYSAF